MTNIFLKIRIIEAIAAMLVTKSVRLRGSRICQILIRLIIFQIRKKHVFLQIVQIQLTQKFFQRLISLFNFDEELLGMGPRLSAGSCSDMLLDPAPLLSVELQCLQKPKVFFLGPTTLFVIHSLFCPLLRFSLVFA
jgi:hypothetical protein